MLYFGHEKHWNMRTLFDRINVPDNLMPYVDEVLKLMSVLTGDDRFEAAQIETEIAA